MLEPIPFWGMIEVDLPVKSYAGNKGIPIQKLKCIVKDCQNHKHEGSFNGDICSPCYQFIAHGKGTYSQAYRNTHPVKELTEILATIKCIADDISGYKDYENTYSDGWLDACNTVYDEVFAILRKAQEK